MLVPRPPDHELAYTLTWLARIRKPFVLLCALSTTFILLVLIVARRPSTATFALPNANLMPGAPYIPQQGCLSLHDGDFRCSLVSDITIIYNGASGRIRYTTQHVHDQTIGDLMLLWGAPDGYNVNSHIIVLMWDRQHTAAYIEGCYLRVNTPVWQVEYGDRQARRLPWRGLMGRVAACHAP